MGITEMAGAALMLGIAVGGAVAAWRGVGRLLRDRQTFDSTGSPLSADEAPHLWAMHLAAFVGLGLFSLAFGLGNLVGLLSGAQ